MSVANPAVPQASDPWDQPSPTQRTVLRRPAKEPVPDDWDADEPDTEDANDAEENQKIWNNANTQAPMPSLVISPSQTSASTTGLSALPPAAFQAPIRILKRSPASTSSSNSASGSSTDPSKNGSSFAEREARYQAARDRIFRSDGGDTQIQSSSGEAIRTGPVIEGRSQTGGVSVVRAPRGPSSPVLASPGMSGPQGGQDERLSKGFIGRNKPPPPRRGSPGQSSGGMQTAE